MPLLPPEHEVHVGDIGTGFRFQVQDTDKDGKITIPDLTTQTTLTVRFTRPSGLSFDRAGLLVGPGTAGVFEYVSIGGDIDKAGRWMRQGFVVLASGSWWTSKVFFEVEDNLPAPV